MDELRCDLCQWLQHESSVGDSGMGQDEEWIGEDDVAVKQDVEIDHAVGRGNAVPA